MILELYLTFVFMGIVMGVIEAYSKKLMFLTWIAAIIYTLFDGFDSSNLKTTYDMSNWHWIPLLAMGILGYYIGKSSYETAFGKKE